MIIYVCVGSGCHLKGSYDIIHAFKDAIERHDLKESVELKASFCLGHCMAGVAIKINNEIILNVTKDTFNRVFEDHVLTPLKKV
ncbi:MAG: (2Fe-2S) ferredoxin domain-containing protein [Bacillota bacterium]